MYKRILAPVDGSHTSTLGLEQAVRLAKNQGARLRIIHVVDESVLTQFPDVMTGTGDLINRLINDGRTVLKNAMTLAKRQGVKAESVMYENLFGFVAELVLKEVTKWRADIIVMGTHGRRGVTHMLLGSDAEAVVRSSLVPVLLVRGAPAAEKKRERKKRKP
jgi:nucleotide-binding universal stress UspA family protein